MKKIFPIQWCRNEHVFHRGYSDHCYTAQWEACPFLRAALIQLEPAYCPGRSPQNRGRPILVVFTCLSCGETAQVVLAESTLTGTLFPRTYQLRSVVQRFLCECYLVF